MSNEDPAVALSEALAEYRAELRNNPRLGHREQARREARLYLLATHESKHRAGSSHMRHWLAYHLDAGKVGQYEQRAALWSRGDEVEALWELLDGPERAALRTVTNLCKQAKNIAATKGYSLREAIEIVLAEYRRAPLRHFQDGTSYRAAAATVEGVIKKVALEHAPKAAKGPKARTRTRPITSSGDVRSANTEVRKIVAQGVVDRLIGYGAEPGAEIILQAVQEAGIEVEALFATVGRIIARAESVIKGTQLPTPSRRRLNEAFRLLNLEPPKNAQAIDMKRVLKQKQRMASLYHPDAHGGDESMRPQFTAVVEAYETIKAYVQEQTHNS
jgi:hypothetical protein